MVTVGLQFYLSLLSTRQLPLPSFYTHRQSHESTKVPIACRSFSQARLFCLTTKHVRLFQPVSGSRPVFHVQEETRALDGGFFFGVKFHLGNEFLMVMPITGEKIKVGYSLQFLLQPNNPTSWTGITENAERRIRLNCTPLQIVHQILNVENKNEAL